MRHRLVVLLALLVTPPVALADDVPSPPDDCAPGSRGQTWHNGPYCEPVPCTTDAECPARIPGTVCREVALCVESRTWPNAGGLSPIPETPEQEAAMRVTRDVAHGACEGGTACAEGTCRVERRCAPRPVRPPAPPPAPTGGGAGGSLSPRTPEASDEGGCAVAGGADGWGWIVAVGLAGWRRRRGGARGGQGSPSTTRRPPRNA